MDIATELERALTAPPGEPAHRPLDDLLVAGHRRLRRRTYAVAGGAVAIVLALGFGVAALTSPGDASGRSIATDPTQPTGLAAEPTPPLNKEGGEYVRYDGTGELLLADGVEVLDRVDNPFAYLPPDTATALRLRVDGEETWTLAFYNDSGDGIRSASSENADPDEVEQRSFAGWVEVKQIIHGDAESLIWLKGVSNDLPVLAPRIGAAIIDEQPNVKLGEGFAPADAVTAAAMVDDAEGNRWFVLVRDMDGIVDYIRLPQEQTDGSQTLAEFLDFARPRYDSGEGLL